VTNPNLRRVPGLPW